MKNLKSGNGELGFILVVLLIIFLIWLALGGSNREEAQGGKYIVPLNDPYNPGATYN